ncbi:epoxyqueuosine reductase [candidate division WOR-3 bacterium]|nr:epoxyqueuosine reductase [candidate division WOR-3 bacterium]
MITKDRIKEIAFRQGVDLFGVASVDRFENAPKGFHPKDIYSKTETVIAFAIRLPKESLFAENPVPFSHTNTLAMQKMDTITYDISTELDKLGVKNVLIPTDDPYLYWDNKKQEGRAILSLRHVGYLAGLGKLGKNNLLINKDYGNMIQIGALLTSVRYESNPMADYEVCPPNCRICLDICPQKALTGETVIQKECRPISNFKTEKGYTIKKCFECRKRCPSVFGIKTAPLIL